MIGMNMRWEYLAPQNIPSAVVLTLGNKAVLYQFSWRWSPPPPHPTPPHPHSTTTTTTLGHVATHAMPGLSFFRVTVPWLQGNEGGSVPWQLIASSSVQIVEIPLRWVSKSPPAPATHPPATPHPNPHPLHPAPPRHRHSPPLTWQVSWSPLRCHAMSLLTHLPSHCLPTTNLTTHTHPHTPAPTPLSSLLPLAT